MASQAARLAGRGAFTAAAVAVVAGGTASMAFAHEAPTAHQVQSAGHEVQGTLTDGAHQFSEGAQKVRSSVDADSLRSHGADLKHQGSDVASSLKSKASSSVLADMATDGGHALSNTKNDLEHARYNWTAAAKDGLTPQEASDQFGLMGDDVAHAVDNGRNDVSHWSSKLSSSVPAGASLLSFG
ncbi:hypothetical protein [Actinomycetospora corticicola]|uniref:Uncharacterized protein n=1 Tax=Actinomycetospora corticicola TaxID=663602 RepID=A0A7Y9DW89_9PSEU|nr:hypothetical protein [Actinomycetospora corticicola]NYD36673.1 hypothetical protein [Actinomycetospora corticicola]